MASGSTGFSTMTAPEWGVRIEQEARAATWNREHFTATFINSPRDLLLIG